MKYLKQFAVKIKIIVNRAEDKALDHKNIHQIHLKPKSENYLRMEDALIEEVRKSRSPYYWNVLACYLQKYDHLVYYPFRNRTLDRIELLRPKPTFFAMLDIASVCISWIATVLMVSLIQNVYSDISKISLMEYGMYIGCIGVITSLLSLLVINRFFRLY